ncbi:hypothetical protein FJR11_20680 [Anabaena sp. UHCC 0187]|uniref:hypothetical protein n=1 Tax=Anabaena sp. UHCC 0187 TaxID=2590018 RepID=UPI00144723D8|nr:hypothetical protein [Anabaena sp. UHCC 0187]MTJ14948.1 hypothetical protein [Anabaena sp. UHCC 0187]
MKLQNQITRITATLSSVLVLCTTFDLLPSVAKQKCGNTDEVQASTTTRTIEFKKFGIKIKIPSNYRTMLRNDGSVMILDPGSYEAVRCAAPRGLYYFSIKLLPNPKKLSLLELAKGSSKQITNEPTNIHNYSLKDTQALIIDAKSGYGAYGIFNVPGKGVVEMSANCDCEVDKTDIIKYLKDTELLK